MKIKNICLIAFLIFFVGFFFCSGCIKQDDGLKRVHNRNALENEAHALAENGGLDEAIELYWKAIEPKNINSEYEKSTAIGAIVDILVWQKKYEEALKEFQWFFENSATGKPTESALEKKEQIEALLTYENTGNKQPILSHIALIKERYSSDLPPKGFSFGSDIQIADILRLYDTIGDLDAGIVYIDMCVEFFKQQDIKKYGEYKPGHADEEYLKVRAAFEQDKRDGTKGRATKALIQSDYFPW